MQKNGYVEKNNRVKNYFVDKTNDCANFSLKGKKRRKKKQEIVFQKNKLSMLRSKSMIAAVLLEQ